MKNEKTKLSSAERWERATLANNFIFCKVMSENKELCRQLLEMLLHVKIERLETPVSEKNVKIDYESHGIRFDVYTKDDNRIFDIEMQTTDKKNLPMRARYYQSMIDTDNFQTGDDYGEIKESYVIFLCLSDIFKKGLPVYSFENYCKEDFSVKLDDKAYKIFFNAQKCDIMPSNEEQAFFRFLQGKSAETDFTRHLATEVIRAKHNAQWRMQFMTWDQSIKEEAELLAPEIAKDMAEDMAKDMAKNMAKDMAQDIAKDMAKDMAQDMAKEQLLTVARRMLSNGMDIVSVAKYMNLPLEEIQQLQ